MKIINRTSFVAANAGGVMLAVPASAAGLDLALSPTAIAASHEILSLPSLTVGPLDLYNVQQNHHNQANQTVVSRMPA